MKLTFLGHSGFLAELEHLLLLFDWWKGELPPLPDKPLLVFASHHHPDHFDPQIFRLAEPGRTVRFLLGKDIRLAPSNKRRWGLTEETAALCLRLGGFRQEQPFPGVVVETLPSTDEGVAFLVTAEGRTIYHAGDLNWWHWAGEHEDWNRKMEQDFKQYTHPLQGRRIDCAMVPLDPRQEDAEGLGLAYLMEQADLAAVLPMHQWEDYSGTARFMQAYPQWADRVISIDHPGQTFILP